MAGRRTFADGQHPYRGARWVPPIKVKLKTWETLSAILGRELDEEEKESISDSLETWKSIYQRRINEVTRKDIKRDLLSIQKLSDAEAIRAFHDCAEATAAEIKYRGAIVFTKTPWEIQNSGPDIKRAAALALTRFDSDGPAGTNPGKPYRLLFIDAMAGLWRSLKMSNFPAWAWGDKATPFVRFVQALLREVEGIEMDAGNLAKLIKKRSSSYL